MGPSTPALTPADIFSEMQAIYDHPFPQDKSPWEILVVPNFTYETTTSNLSASHYAFIVRMHHGVMDGISAGNGMHATIYLYKFVYLIFT